jgi:RNA polymerase sigma factor (sigma-70 family)
MNLPEADDQLAARIAQGDRAALGTLYERESGRVFRYVMAMTRDEEIAADVTQETFLKFATQISAFDATRGPLQAYLVGISRHLVLGKWNEDKRYANESVDEEVDPSSDADPADALVTRRSREALHAAIAGLPTSFREALVLVELQDFSYADAARIAGIELNTLRTRVHRAKVKLAALLNSPAKRGDGDES